MNNERYQKITCQKDKDINNLKSLNCLYSTRISLSTKSIYNVAIPVDIYMYIHFFETYRVTKKIFIRLFWLNVRNPRTEHGIGVFFSLKVRKWGKGGEEWMDQLA